MAEYKQQIEELMNDNVTAVGQKDQLESSRFIVTSKLVFATVTLSV